MSDVVIKPNRRSTDLAPVRGEEAFNTREIKEGAKIGRRATDNLLERRFTKADQPSTLLDIEKEFDPTELIISRTDLRGTITYCNDIFSKMSGWRKEELLGSNHNLIRHPDMPQIAFKLAWDIIKAKKEFYGYVKNLRKDGSYYWVFAYITADLDPSGDIVGYTSYRRFAPKLAIDAVVPIYKLLLEAEKKKGMEFSEQVFYKILEKNGYTNYDQFIIDLQVKANASVA